MTGCLGKQALVLFDLAIEDAQRILLVAPTTVFAQLAQPRLEPLLERRLEARPAGLVAHRTDRPVRDARFPVRRGKRRPSGSSRRRRAVPPTRAPRRRSDGTGAGVPSEVARAETSARCNRSAPDNPRRRCETASARRTREPPMPCSPASGSSSPLRVRACTFPCERCPTLRPPIARTIPWPRRPACGFPGSRSGQRPTGQCPRRTASGRPRRAGCPSCHARLGTVSSRSLPIGWKTGLLPHNPVGGQTEAWIDC